MKAQKRKRRNSRKRKRENVWVPNEYWRDIIDQQIKHWYKNIKKFCNKFKLKITEKEYPKYISAFIHPSALKYYPESFDPETEDYKLYEQHGDKVLAFRISEYFIRSYFS